MVNFKKTNKKDVILRLHVKITYLLKRLFIVPLLTIGHTGTPLHIPVILRSSNSLGYRNDTGWLSALLNLLTG